MSLVTLSLLMGVQGATPGPSDSAPQARMLVEYFEKMSEPEPFTHRSGDDFERHKTALREKLLRCVGLDPLPSRVPLDLRMTESLMHPWCTVRRVYFQLWPGVEASALLYLPAELPNAPAPAVLCPHGHWTDGNRHPDVQRRCLTLAKAGFVVLSTTQYHYEDVTLGISHQTIMIWNNMRALDVLDSLDEVDDDRIGVCGASGGGLQTQMLTALDPRIKAAVIVGMTCDFREIMFPHQAHCDCNHYPNVMQFTDAPEVSALACPTPVLYLTMDDWTGRFQEDNFPTIKALYGEHGAPDKVKCVYEPTPHSYDRSKREMTYAWMQKHLRNGPPFDEPESVETFTPEQLASLALDSVGEPDLALVSGLFREQFGHSTPELDGEEAAGTYCRTLAEAPPPLLGLAHTLRATSEAPELTHAINEDGLRIERILFPSEGPILVPTLVLHEESAKAKRPVVIICDADGKDACIAEQGPGSARDLASQGALVVLPDIRFTGELSFANLAGNVGPDRMRFKPVSPLGMASALESQTKDLARAWRRNAIVWGRPFSGMACTDIQAVLNSLARRDDADMADVSLIARGSGDVAMAALFAACIDARITHVDADLTSCCFSNGGLSAVPFVLRHGDVLQWTALLADRRVTLRSLPREAGDAAWLRNVFAVTENPDGLIIVRD